MLEEGNNIVCLADTRTLKSLAHYFIIAGAAFLNIAGMWAAVEGLIVLFNTTDVDGPFTCADSSLF